MKSRPRIKFLQLPHSVAQRIESLTNRTAAALLSFLCRKTIGFGQGVVELSYQQLAQNLKVDTRTISRAAKILESAGDIIRDRPAGGVYRWRIVLNKDEVIADPTRTYSTRSTRPQKQGEVMIDRSAPPCRLCHDPHDTSIMTLRPDTEQHKPCNNRAEAAVVEQPQEPLKILIKDKDLKKQHHCVRPVGENAPSEGQSHLDTCGIQPAVRGRTDDEPLHKSCLKGLREQGVSQRMARKLCREHNHELILSVLKTAPQRPGIKNLPAYIVSEIQDGGYEQTSTSTEQKTAYAHLTDKKRSSARSNTVKTTNTIDAPIAYRSVEQTKTELQALEENKLEQEQKYQNKSRQLAERFKNLPQELQFQLKLVASVHLSKLVPASEKREEMLRDKTFQRMANRTILERFFEWVDEGLDELQALQRLELKAAA